MSNERILSYNQSKVLTQEEAESVYGAGMSTSICAQPSYHGSIDGTVDATIDF